MGHVIGGRDKHFNRNAQTKAVNESTFWAIPETIGKIVANNNNSYDLFVICSFSLVAHEPSQRNDEGTLSKQKLSD